MSSHAAIAELWSDRLRAFCPTFIDGHPALATFKGRMSLVLHGSTTMGVDDAFSDLDLWLLLPDASLKSFDLLSPTRFIAFELGGKQGHMCVHGAEEFAASIVRCHMDTIYQLRRGIVLADADGVAERLQALARRPMCSEVRHALFLWHYTEMRGEHRACDTPMERVDPPAVLLSLTKAIAHGLQAAIVLDGQPYPYDKWLCRAARDTSAGAKVAASVDRIIDMLGQGQLRFAGGETAHPISQELRVMRRVLVEAARERGIDEPWLDKWWLYMDQAREAFRDVRW